MQCTHISGVQIVVEHGGGARAARDIAQQQRRRRPQPRALPRQHLRARRAAARPRAAARAAQPQVPRAQAAL